MLLKEGGGNNPIELNRAKKKKVKTVNRKKVVVFPLVLHRFALMLGAHSQTKKFFNAIFELIHSQLRICMWLQCMRSYMDYTRLWMPISIYSVIDLKSLVRRYVIRRMCVQLKGIVNGMFYLLNTRLSV